METGRLQVLPELSARVVEAKRTGSSELPSLHELLVALQTETAQVHFGHPHRAFVCSVCCFRFRRSIARIQAACYNLY